MSARHAVSGTADYGFALGGGNAMLAHGIITRPTQDVDLFTNQELGAETAAGAVEAALRAAGFRGSAVAAGPDARNADGVGQVRYGLQLLAPAKVQTDQNDPPIELPDDRDP